MSVRARYLFFGACAVLAFGLPADAITMNGAPLRISTCDVAYMMGVPGYGNGFTNGVTFTVKNLSTRTITSFSGGGRYDSALITDTITHTLAPGESYKFKRSYKPLFYSGSNAPCFISSVAFGDGTTWSAPKVSP